MCIQSTHDESPIPEVTDFELKKLREEMDAPNSDALLWYERFWFCFGAVLLMCILPVTVPAVGLSVLWDAVDRGFMGRPQDGVIMSSARWLNKKTAGFWAFAVKKKEDAFLVNVVLLLGVFVPGLFFYSFYYTMQNGFSLYLCVAYHMVRLGPYFMNFAYTYSSCHKECHNHSGIFTGWPGLALNHVFNWWIGLFFGVLPSSFAFGHAINHHRYNNGPSDLLTTADKPRDNFRNFVAFIPRFFLYATNISTVWQFILDKEYDIALKMNVGTIYFIMWTALFYSYSPIFALCYIVMPLGENVILLSAVQWCWHAFLNHKDPEDDYVGSVTLLDGPINVMEEDYHVVHHVYPGLHWTDHAAYYERDLAAGKYGEGPATCFKGTHTFELFFLIILREYDMMAKHFHDPRGQWTHEDKKNAIKVRLRTCWWGPRRNLSIKLTGKEIRKK